MTVAQFRTLTSRATKMERPSQIGEMTAADLVGLGYSRQEAERILHLLNEEERLDAYLSRGWSVDCIPISRVSADYPLSVRQRLGMDAPGCLWAKGDRSLLTTQTISLAGCRELREPNHAFAKRVGAVKTVPIHIGLFDNLSADDFCCENKVVPQFFKEIEL